MNPLPLLTTITTTSTVLITFNIISINRNYRGIWQVLGVRSHVTDVFYVSNVVKYHALCIYPLILNNGNTSAPSPFRTSSRRQSQMEWYVRFDEDEWRVRKWRFRCQNCPRGNYLYLNQIVHVWFPQTFSLRNCHRLKAKPIVWSHFMS